MNTKVKIGIAGAIVAALVALIVLDQKAASTPVGTTGGGASTVQEVSAPVGNAGDPSQNRNAEVRDLLRRVQENLGTEGSTRPTAAPAPSVIPAPPIPAPNPVPVRGDEYVIQSGDTLETIALTKYGSRFQQTLIVEANPGLNPHALRIGKTIILPSKVEKGVEAPLAKDLTTSPADVTGAKTYVIQPGDTLSGISNKVYKTSRNVDKIIEANRDRISDPHLLSVGTKLTMPELPVRNASVAPTAQVQASAPAAGGKTHTVQSGDSLWRVAEKYATEKGLGILEMMGQIIKANPEKLKDEKTLLRLGWQIIVPE